MAESFFKTLKAEMVYGRKLLPGAELRTEIFEWIECWHNRKRRHSALNNLTIDEFWERVAKHKPNSKIVSQLNLQF